MDSAKRAWTILSEHKNLSMNDDINIFSVVRNNLMNQEGYSPYCGNDIARNEINGCDNPRTVFNGEQFVCPHCNWISQFPKEFILMYKEKWGLVKKIN